jgi:glucosamine--fructose-6-phosphate aminotransferase (isomerizing)
MILVGLLFALGVSNVSNHSKKEIINDVRKLPNIIFRQLLDIDDAIGEAADLISGSNPPLFIGRGGLSSSVAREGALKMMEISYIPCLSFPGGELKHGPIALISENSPVVAIAPSDSKLNLMESSIRECKARGASIILITDNEGPITNLADILIQVPTVHEYLYPVVNAIAIQLLAYRVGIKNAVNVDRPRNLAKSVTVV